jgi:hypothetical protein
MYQQLWGYKVEEKLYLGVREQKRLNTTDLERVCVRPVPSASSSRYQSDTGLLPLHVILRDLHYYCYNAPMFTFDTSG